MRAFQEFKELVRPRCKSRHHSFERKQSKNGIRLQTYDYYSGLLPTSDLLFGSLTALNPARTIVLTNKERTVNIGMLMELRVKVQAAACLALDHPRPQFAEVDLRLSLAAFRPHHFSKFHYFLGQ